MVYRMIPKTATADVIDSFADRISLGRLVTTVPFILVSAFLSHRAFRSDPFDWMSLLFAIVFGIFIHKKIDNTK